MKLLFVCDAKIINKTLKCPGWIRGIISRLDDDFSVTILSAGCAGSDAVELSVEQRPVRWLGRDRWYSSAQLASVADEEKADVTVIFGTEKTYSLRAMELCRDAGLLNRTVLFAQGLAYACAAHYAEGVPERIIRRSTLRDLLRRENIRKEQKNMEARAADEQKAITLARHFMGRTVLDRSILRMYNSDAVYYRCNDILQSCFYEGQWRYDACEKHRIFVSQFYYPLKGFHYLLKAVSLLKEKYPDIRIAAAGYNPILGSVTQNEIKDSSYIRYIKSLIRQYGLEGHIELTGELDEQRMKEEYLKANVFVLPSTIENSPNSLGEAMMLGVPCVASDVGGTADFVRHKEHAFLYPSSASYLLANYIDELFADPQKAAKLGENARKRAAVDYDAEVNKKALEDAFRSIAHTEKS